MPRKRRNRSTPTHPPLPQRNGIDPVSFTLPDNPAKALHDTGKHAVKTGTASPSKNSTSTVAGFLTARFYPDNPRLISTLFTRGEVRTDGGTPLPLGAPYKPGLRIWYYRPLPDEPALPDDIPVLYEDEHLLAVDKPHFLPTTPRGSFIAQTVLTKLRVRENNPLLTPAHRLDRATAGVLLLAKTPAARAPLQRIFQDRLAIKEYLAVAPLLPDKRLRLRAKESGLIIRSRIKKYAGSYRLISGISKYARPKTSSPIPSPSSSYCQCLPRSKR